MALPDGVVVDVSLTAGELLRHVFRLSLGIALSLVFEEKDGCFQSGFLLF
jgi:hypothetical protein